MGRENVGFRSICHDSVVVGVCYLLAVFVTAVVLVAVVAVTVIATVAVPYSYVEHSGLSMIEKPLLQLQLRLP